MNKEKSVLVVGGAGYIGSHTAHKLIEKQYNVTVFDNLSTGCKENIPPEADFIEGDILSENDISEIFRKNYDAVFHFAALKAAGESMLKPEKYARINLNGTIKLLTAAVSHNVEYFIFSSSAAVYGEPTYIPVDENHTANPANYYGYTKLAIEENLRWFSRLKSMRYAALRYFNAAGYHPEGKISGLEKNPANLIPLIMETAQGKRPALKIYGNDYPTPDGTCIRDYIHVEDLAEAHVIAYQYIMKNNKNIVLNLGTGEGASVLEVVEAAREITGKKIPFELTGRREGDPPEVIASAALAEEIIHWKPRYSDLKTILRTTAAAYNLPVK